MPFRANGGPKEEEASSKSSIGEKDDGADDSSSPSKDVDDAKKKDGPKTQISFCDSELGQSLRIIRRKITPRFLKRQHRLVTEKETLQWSLMSVRFAVLADACSFIILQPNYPFIALPGFHEDSFPNTDPFGWSAATYFLPMTAMLAAAITSSFVGSLSDRIGRKPCILACVGVSVIGTLMKYVARETFWGFCAANFTNGLFAASVPAALAYASDVHPNRQKKDKEIGMLIGINMIGLSGGGIAAILMEEQGLFSPLFIGAAMNVVAAIGIYFIMIEADANIHFEEEVDEEDMDAPQTMNWRLFSNVNLGALLDNIGSAGLYPMALTPLAFETFLKDFLQRGESPIMSEVGYKWIAVLITLMVIPGAALSQPIFDRIGPAGGCVFGNMVTAVGILGCMLICAIEPPTSGTLAGFVVLLYGVFPLTVISQLSTGPMLDRLSPVDRRGLSQGINVTIMNFANALSPWIFGIISDNIGINPTLWITIGVSLVASLVNLPLTWAPPLRAKKKVDYQQAMNLEDEELVERAMRGEWVPTQFLMDLNEARMRSGLPFLDPPITKYEDDKDNLPELRKHAKEDFEFCRNKFYGVLAELEDPNEKAEVVQQINKVRPQESEREKHAEDMGAWVGQYMKDAGYFSDGGLSSMHKQMIMKAFPVINKDNEEITEENVEGILVRYIAVVNDYLDDEGPKSRSTQAFSNSVVY